MRSLMTDGTTWTKIRDGAFTPSPWPCAVTLSNKKILIMGGGRYMNYNSDSYLLEQGSDDEVTVTK